MSIAASCAPADDSNAVIRPVAGCHVRNDPPIPTTSNSIAPPIGFNARTRSGIVPLTPNSRPLPTVHPRSAPRSYAANKCFIPGSYATAVTPPTSTSAPIFPLPPSVPSDHIRLPAASPATTARAFRAATTAVTAPGIVNSGSTHPTPSSAAHRYTPPSAVPATTTRCRSKVVTAICVSRPRTRPT